MLEGYTKDELMGIVKKLKQHVNGLKGNIIKMKECRIRDKIETMFLGRKITLLEMKLAQWENGASKRSYAHIGKNGIKRMNGRKI